MAENHDTPRTTFLPPKAGQSNIRQSSGKLNSKLSEVRSFQAPKFQEHSKRVKFQGNDSTNHYTTFLPPNAKEHKKPLLPKDDLGLRSVISFLPPSVKRDPELVVETKTINYPLTTFRPPIDHTRSSNNPVLPPDPIIIQELEATLVAEIQVDDAASLPKTEVKFEESSTNFIAVSLQAGVDQDVLLPLNEPEGATNLGQLSVESKPQELKPENEFRIEKLEKPQPVILKETNQEKGLNDILLVGGGIGVGLLVLLALAWFLVKEPGHPAPSGGVGADKIQPNLTKKDAAPPAPKPIAYAQVVTKEGSSLKMYADKSRDSAQLGIIPNQAIVEVMEYAYYSILDGDNGRWVYVKYQGKTGWCWGNFLKEIQK